MKSNYVPMPSSLTWDKLKAINPETGTIYSRDQLHTAFGFVQNPENWKLPIDAVIPEDQKDLVTEAIIFFAGCRPYFSSAPAGYVRVQAEGYYAAIGA